MFGGFGVWEIALIFLVILLLFGAKRLPEIGSSLGKGIREFKGSLREIENELKLPEDRSQPSASSTRREVASDPVKSGSSDATSQEGNGEAPRSAAPSQ